MTLDEFRARFPILARRVYVNTCSQGALSIDVDEAMRAYLDSWHESGSPWEMWVAQVERLRARFAASIGAGVDEIAVMPSASAGINAVASSLTFDTPRSHVVVGDFEFPTMAQAWMAQERRGATIRRARVASTSPDTLPLDAYDAVVDERTLLVPAAHVCFRNGHKTDIAGLTRLAHERGAYVLLDAGSTLGRNCGPLLISKRSISPHDVAAGTLRIAIPGKFTTANFLLGLAFPAAQDTTALLFSAIEPALLNDEYDAGLIIHENRFTYAAKGLKKIIDLGEFWEGETGAPIPLGGIAIKRALPDEVKQAVNRVVRRSVEYAFAHRAASLPFVREHAQEMSEDVMYRHIDLYVNDYSVDLGAEGRRAVELLFEKARATGIIPDVKEGLFL